MQGTGPVARDFCQGERSDAEDIRLSFEFSGDPAEEDAPLEEEGGAENGRNELIGLAVETGHANGGDGEEGPADKGEKEEKGDVVAFDVTSLVSEDGLDLAVFQLFEHSVGDEDISEGSNDAHDSGVDEHAAGTPDEDFAIAHAQSATEDDELVPKRSIGETIRRPDVSQQFGRDHGDDDGKGAQEEVGDETAGKEALKRAIIDRDDVARGEDEQHGKEDEEHLVSEIEEQEMEEVPDGARGAAAEEVKLEGDLSNGAVGWIGGDPHQEHGEQEWRERGDLADERPGADGREAMADVQPIGQEQQSGKSEAEESLCNGQATSENGLPAIGVGRQRFERTQCQA